MKQDRVYKAKLIRSGIEILLIYNDGKFIGALFPQNKGIGDYSKIIKDIVPPLEHDFSEYNVRFKDRIHYTIYKEDVSKYY